MNITKEHSIFYASKKSNIFKSDISIHTLINSQLNNRFNADKLNNLTQLRMIINRCNRQGLSLKNELFKACLSDTMHKSRKAMFYKYSVKLDK